MSNFIGKWKDQANVEIDVTGQGRTITIKYQNGRGPFTGHVIDLYHPVIDVNFSDKVPETGVMSNDGKKIYWCNGSEWVKQD